MTRCSMQLSKPPSSALANCAKDKHVWIIVLLIDGKMKTNMDAVAVPAAGTVGRLPHQVSNAAFAHAPVCSMFRARIAQNC